MRAISVKCFDRGPPRCMLSKPSDLRCAVQTEAGTKTIGSSTPLLPPFAGRRRQTSTASPEASAAKADQEVSASSFAHGESGQREATTG
uniref:Uncharacterized protein n=1 Tax=Arundo donax TaxID=35708 RepID=A0A0A8YTL7_ARUDO